VIQRRPLSPGFLKRILALATLLGLAPGVTPVQAQQVTTLIQFTDVWRYDQSGQELGTAWRTNSYADSEWASGMGLLGTEPNTPMVYTVHAPISTPLIISSTVTTYFFRTTFNFAGTTNGLSLVASNLVDDGFVIYLNGRESGRARVPANQNAATMAVGGPASEGLLETTSMTNLALLREGENLIAVEVHQAGPASSDVMWGMKLLAIQATPLAITSQPRSLFVALGHPVTLFVGISGGPAFYRWEKDGVVQSSTSNTLTIASAQLASAGDYRVIVTNSISAVTSSVATLTVVADTFGPTILAAIGNNIPNGGGTPFGSNTINVLFSEDVSAISARNTNNYTVTRLGTTNTVHILSALHSTALGVLLIVDASDPDWIPGGDYVLAISNVTDTRGNVIAPDSRVAVSWLQTTNVIHDAWRFHNSWIFDPYPIATNWYACDFIEGSWWADGHGCFYFGPSQEITFCGETVWVTPTGFQPEPVLFRTSFDWPTSLPTTDVVLRPRFVVDDGAVFYLNGVEIARYNMPGGPISETTRAATIIATPLCFTNVAWTVTNLVSGSNCLAVGVFQAANATDADVTFCFELDARYPVTPALALEPAPALTATPQGADQLRLSWTGHGYALESATSLSLGSTSYPVGPWQQVTNMSNPYTNRLDELQRFFRLKK
jgi:hypothetical protein